MMNEILAKVYRGKTIESIHYGSVVVVDSSSKLVYRIGDPSFVTFLRSSAKPFQAIPAVESGVAEAFGFTQQEIAIIAGSHNGEKKHVKLVKSILKKVGLNKGFVQCGTHVPHYYTASGMTPRKKKFSPLQHNCSAKHAGMLAMCVYKNWNLKNYLNPNHPVQKLILKRISELCEYPEKKIKIGIEGCGAPTHGLPLKNMAIGFSKLVTFRSKNEITSQALQVVADSMWKYPEMVSGRGRLDYALVTASKGKLICKAGAEALHCAAILDKGWGLAIKILDGTRRAVNPASVEVYRQLEIIRKSRLKELRDFACPSIYNHKKAKVGFIKSDFQLKRAR
jgi:L-asparaginase II